MKKISLLAHQKRVRKIRKKMASLNVVRLAVHRTPRHIYAQIIAADGKILASASSLEKIIKEAANMDSDSNNGKINIAKMVGKLIAERGKTKVDHIAFDRSGFKYHGRIKALADSAREFGLNF